MKLTVTRIIEVGGRKYENTATCDFDPDTYYGSDLDTPTEENQIKARLETLFDSCRLRSQEESAT